MSTKKTKSKKGDMPATEEIVAAAERMQRPGLFVIINMAGRCGDCVPRSSNPSFLHRNLESAHVEATRLAGLNPGAPFAVFHCIGLAEAKIQAPEVREATEADIAGPQQMEW